MVASSWTARFRLILIQSLWLLVSLGPFLHAHAGQSHYEGFHDDAIQRVAGLTQHLHDNCVIETSEFPESPAVVVGSSISREWEETGETSSSAVELTLTIAWLWHASSIPSEAPLIGSPPPIITPANIWVSIASPSQAPPHFWLT